MPKSLVMPTGVARTRTRRARRGLLALLACAVVAGLLAAPASAETDPPQLTDLTLDPATVNTSASDQTVTIEIFANDAGSGIHHVIARLAEPGGVQFDTSFFGQPTTGNPFDGMWRLEVTLPQFSPQGTYDLSIEIVDEDGNALVLSQAQLQSQFGVPYIVNQVAPGDLNPPSLGGVSFSPAAVDTSDSDRVVNVTVNGLDDLSGVELINARLSGPGGTEITGAASGNPDTGVPTNGSWVVPMIVPQGSPTGTYTLSLDLTDGVGRLTSLTSGQIAGLGFPNSIANNDATAPPLSIQSGPNGPTNQTTPTFTFTAEAGAALQCSIDQGTPSFGPCASGSSHSAGTPLADGDWTFRVQATDAANNVATATRSFTVDTVAPDTQIDSGPDGLIATATADFAFTSEAGAGFECRLDGGDFQSCGSPKSYAGLGDGDHTFEVRAVDVAGNPDPSPASRSFSVDADAPVVVITSGPDGPTTEALPTFGFEAEAGSEVECSFDQGSPGFGPCSTPSSATPGAPLAEGDWTFRVRATDAGKRSSTATRSFTVDLQLPETTIDKAPPGRTFKKRATFKFTGEGADRFECKFDQGRWGACTSPTKYKKLKKGKHTFKVRAIDAAGNIDATPAEFNFKVVRLAL